MFCGFKCAEAYVAHFALIGLVHDFKSLLQFVFPGPRCHLTSDDNLIIEFFQRKILSRAEEEEKIANVAQPVHVPMIPSTFSYVTGNERSRRRKRTKHVKHPVPVARQWQWGRKKHIAIAFAVKV